MRYSVVVVVDVTGETYTVFPSFMRKEGTEMFQADSAADATRKLLRYLELKEKGF